MTPAQLRTYAAVVRNGSARRAAQELDISEAAVSAHTAALRKELDDRLYFRSANGLSFTPGGLRLATRAVEMLGLADLTRQEVTAAGQGKRVLRLATTSLFAEYCAPGLIEVFGTRADDLDVELSVHRSDRLGELLASRLADIIIRPSAPESSEVVRFKELLKYQLLVVGAPSHPLVGVRCEPNAMRQAEWLLGPSAVEPNGATGKLLARFDVPETKQRVFQSHSAAMAEAVAGRGLAIVPEFRARDTITSGRLCRLDVSGGAVAGVWGASGLLASQSTGVASEFFRFVTTPRAVQAMLSGSGANVGHFRPSVHITLWS